MYFVSEKIVIINILEQITFIAKTSLGLEENIEGALCYVLGWITGIVFYLLEKENKFVRFHAMQSILTFFPLWILSIIFGGWSWLLLWHVWFFLGLDIMDYMGNHVYSMADIDDKGIPRREIQIANCWRHG